MGGLQEDADGRGLHPARGKAATEQLCAVPHQPQECPTCVPQNFQGCNPRQAAGARMVPGAAGSGPSSTLTALCVGVGVSVCLFVSVCIPTLGMCPTADNTDLHDTRGNRKQGLRCSGCVSLTVCLSVSVYLSVYVCLSVYWFNCVVPSQSSESGASGPGRCYPTCTQHTRGASRRCFNTSVGSSTRLVPWQTCTEV